MQTLQPLGRQHVRARTLDAVRAIANRTVLGGALLLSGVLVFADAGLVAGLGAAATVALLVAIGAREGRWPAMLWALLLIGSAAIADTLWQLDWEPFNRSHDYEAIPQTPFVLVAVPIPMAVVAVGVAARRAGDRLCAARRR